MAAQVSINGRPFEEARELLKDLDEVELEFEYGTGSAVRRGEAASVAHTGIVVAPS